MLLSTLAKAALVGLFFTTVAGCADHDDYRAKRGRCERFARSTVECYDPIGADPWSDEREFRRRVEYLTLSCRSKLDENAPALEAMLQCAPAEGSAPNCPAFDACSRASTEAANGAQLEAAVETGDEVRVLALCAMDTELKGCVAAKEGLVDAMIKGRLHAIRDGSNDQAPSTMCFRAKALARSAAKGGPSVRAVALMNRVERACRQAAAGRRIREVLVEIERLRKTKRMRIPHRCKSLLSELTRLDSGSKGAGKVQNLERKPRTDDSDTGGAGGGTGTEAKAHVKETMDEALEVAWTSQARNLVARVCYVDWGRTVLDKLLASARKCNPALQDIVTTAREHHLEKALGARYRSALELCPTRDSRGPGVGGGVVRPSIDSKGPTRLSPGASRRR